MSVMTVSVVITQLLALILKMLMPRVFGPEKMGVFLTAETFSGLFFSFLPLGLATYINRNIPSRPTHVKDILWTIFLLQGLMAVVILLAMYGTLVWQHEERELIIAALIMGAYGAIFTFQKEIFQKIYITLGKVKLVSQLNVVVKVILVGGSVIVLFTEPSVAGIAAMYLLSEAVGFILLIRNAKGSEYFVEPPTARLIKSILKVSLPFYLAGVLNGIYAQIDIYMLARLSTKTEVGYFGSAFRMIGVFLFLVPIFQNSVTPPLSQAYARSDGSFAALAKDILKNLLLFSLALTGGLVLFGDLFTTFLNGPEFMPSQRILAHLTPVLVMMYLNIFLGALLYLTSSGQRLSLIFIVGSVFNVALDWYLIPYGTAHLGIGGPGIAISFVTLCCELFVFACMNFMLPEKVMTPRNCMNLFWIFVLCGVGMYFHTEITALNILSRGLLLCLVPVYALLTGMLTKQDIARARAIAGKRWNKA